MLADISTGNLLDALEVAKWVFVTAYVFSTIGVTVGVYWESERFSKEKQHRGWRLLICSLAADTFFTIMVFGIEGWIGHIQRDEIIALELQIAPRQLTSEEENALIGLLEKYPGRTVRVSSYMQDIEGATVGAQLLRAVAAAQLPLNDGRMRVNSYAAVTSGLAVTGTDAPLIEAVTALLSATKLAPVSNMPVENNWMDVDDENAPLPLKIFVGVKPLPPTAP
jgi:hypothetical protein